MPAAECARADIRDERRVWRDQRQPRMQQQPYRFVFLEETGVNTRMVRLRGRSRKGERLPASALTGRIKSGGLCCRMPGLRDQRPGAEPAQHVLGLGTRNVAVSQFEFRLTTVSVVRRGGQCPIAGYV